MFHYIKGKIKRNQSDCFILTEMFGVQVAYAGGQSEGDFFLYPYLDEGKKSVFYFAFDTLEQKQNKSDFSSIFTYKTTLNKSKTTILKYLFLSKIQAKNLIAENWHFTKTRYNIVNLFLE